VAYPILERSPIVNIGNILQYDAFRWLDGGIVVLQYGNTRIEMKVTWCLKRKNPAKLAGQKGFKVKHLTTEGHHAV